MSGTEILIVVVALVAGYWIVSRFLEDSPRAGRDPAGGPPPPAQPPPWSSDMDPAEAPWSSILGVAPDASVEDIRRAYHEQRGQYHPDKVAALGVELQALAERKSKEIGTAYRRAMRERGVSEQLW